MPAPSTAYLIESALYGDPLDPPDLTGDIPINPAPHASDIPSNYIPGTWTLGSTYNVLNGLYADSRSTKQQVIDWSKSNVRTQLFGGREYSVPTEVNFTSNTSSVYQSSHGKTTSDYVRELSVHAGFETRFPGFSASASTDYSQSQRENLSNAFTRIQYNVTHYNLSLRPPQHIQRLLKLWFIDDLDNMDPMALYREYGTHLLRSLTIGGRALFLYSTDTRSYSSDMSIEAAARLSARYFVASASMDLSVSQREAMESFNQSSQTSVVTRGGDPQYGNEEFLQNASAWAASVLDFPEFVEFGPRPCFAGIWEFASTDARRETLRNAYAEFVQRYAADLSLPAPYLHARNVTSDFDQNKRANIYVRRSDLDHTHSSTIRIDFPNTLQRGWFLISPSVDGRAAVIAQELVPGALAPVKWVEVHVFYAFAENHVTRIWRATPTTSDYVALGFVAMTGHSIQNIPSQPPASLTDQFRAVHKAALTGAVHGAGLSYVDGRNYWRGPGVVFQIDHRYWLADGSITPHEDLFVLDPKMTRRGWIGW